MLVTAVTRLVVNAVDTLELPLVMPDTKAFVMDTPVVVNVERLEIIDLEAAFIMVDTFDTIVDCLLLKPRQNDSATLDPMLAN